MIAYLSVYILDEKFLVRTIDYSRISTRSSDGYLQEKELYVVAASTLSPKTKLQPFAV